MRVHNIRDSERAGIVIIHQELALIPELSIAENIFLGNEARRGGVIDWLATRGSARELLARVGLDEDPDTPHQATSASASSSSSRSPRR